MRNAEVITDCQIKEEIEYVFKNYVRLFLEYESLEIYDKKPKLGRNKYLFEYLGYCVVIKSSYIDALMVKIIGEVISQLSVITRMVLGQNPSRMGDKLKYRDALYKSATLRGMIQWLCAGSCNELVYDIINVLADWSVKTYERSHVKYGILLDTSTNYEKTNIQLLEHIVKEISATISDGENTLYLADKNGEIQKVDGWRQIQAFIKNEIGATLTNNHLPLAPRCYTNICGLSRKFFLGITLSSNGEICCFKGNQLVLARLNGKWTAFNYSNFEKTFSTLSNFSQMKGLIKEIYLSCLDVAFEGTGGCIAIIDDKFKDEANSILPKEIDYRNKVEITSVYTHDFVQLSRDVRKELLAIDGACILYSNGTIRAMGAIINKVKQQKTGGARAAAAATISKYGIAIKISADGYFQIYKDGKRIG